MKQLRLVKKSCYLLMVFLVIGAMAPLLFLPHPASANGDYVTTLAATNLTTSSASLNGYLDNCWTEPVWVSFEWGLTTSCELGTTTEQEMMSSFTPFTAEISGLSAGTTYYFRAKADDHIPLLTVHYGSVMSFTTTSATSTSEGEWYQMPAVITVGADNVHGTSATLSGNLTSTGSAGKVEAYFKYGTTWAAAVYPAWAGGSVTPAQVLDSPGIFSADISGLSPGTTYYFKALAYGEGIGRGVVKTFTTP